MGCHSVVAAIIVVLLMLLVLECILGFVAHEGTRESAEHTVAAHLVAAKVSRSAAAECAHQTTITLCLRVGVSGSVAGLALCVAAILLALGILLLGVCALLRELLRGGLARVLLLSVLSARLCQSCFETNTETGNITDVERTLGFVRIGRKARGFVHAGILLVLEVRSLRIAVAVVLVDRNSRQSSAVGAVEDIVGRSPDRSLAREGPRNLGLAREIRTGLAEDIAAGRSPGCIDRKVLTL